MVLFYTPLTAWAKCVAKNSLKNSFRFVHCVSYYVIIATTKMCPISKRTATETTKHWGQKQKKEDRQTFQKKGKKLKEKRNLTVGWHPPLYFSFTLKIN